jgi:hypothetical protein
MNGKLWFEDRIGGQKNFDDKNEVSSSVYGQTVRIKSGDLYSRFSHEFKNGNSLKVLASGSHYNMKSFYGVTKYDAMQNLLNGSMMYEFELPGESFLKAGVSYKYRKVDENIAFIEQTNKSYSGNYVKTNLCPEFLPSTQLTYLMKRLR